MLSAFRYLASICIAVTVTFGLVYTMQYLISNSDRDQHDAEAGHIVDFIRIKRNEVINRKKHKPEKPPQPKTPPPEPAPPQLNKYNPTVEKIRVSTIPVNTEISMTAGGISLTPGDAEYLPIIKIAPVYPPRALKRGISGHVIVEFTVTKQGRTKDIIIIESQPESTIFHRAAIKAASKFKYKPRTEDGKPIEVIGVRNKITFRLEK